MRILLVEDNQLLGEGLCDALHDEGETIDWLKDGKQALHALQVEAFDLLVLDLGLPLIDGLEVLRRLRGGEHILADNRHLPVLILTARDGISERVTGLDLGADDYLTKPFDVAELLARIRALLRRSRGRSEADIQLGALCIQPAERKVTLNQRLLTLSRREYALLTIMAGSPGKVFSKQQLSQTVYGWGEEVESNALEVHIHNLRKKLDGQFIRTVRGVGYTIEEPAGAGLQ
jgi:two-component system response regulator QseB